jgi:hypothetical protein
MMHLYHEGRCKQPFLLTANGGVEAFILNSRHVAPELTDPDVNS